MSQNSSMTRRMAMAKATAATGTLGLSATALPALCQTATPAQGQTHQVLNDLTLKDLAVAKGLRFGNAVGIRALQDPKVKALIQQECNILVSENELKMYVTQNNDPVGYNFTPADTILAFAQANAIPMRGHTLFWARDEYTPKWLLSHDFGNQPKVAAEKMLRDYIRTLATRYDKRIISWDVVNETVDPETGKVRDNVFSRILGMDALRIAYDEARQHLPKTQLVYNDYMSWETGNEKHREGVLTLLRWFRDNKVSVNALGVQSHLGNGADLMHGQVNQWKAWLDAVVAMDYDLLITEFDVCDQTIPTNDIEQRDAIVATVGRIYLDQMLSYKQTKDVLFWGMPDKYNWLQGFRPRTDKAPLRPTPFDDNFEKKPLYYAIAESFKTAPSR